MKQTYAKEPTFGGVAGWKRITEFKDQAKPSLWGSQGVSPMGALQGSLGSCWFLAAASALAEHPARIKTLFANTNYPANGVFLLHFYLKGERVAVTVDDKLPYSKGTNKMYTNYGVEKVVNTNMSDNGAWWLPIMEKAWGKFFGSFDNINGGFESEALRKMSNVPVLDFKPSKLGADAVFRQATMYDKKGYTMTTGCCARKYGDLYGGHAYTLIGTVTLKTGGGTVRLMKIRNPHGREVYTGPWCDKCKEWTPELRMQAGMVNKNDGIFHIPVEEYIQTFDTWTVALFDNWKVAKARGNTKAVNKMQTFKIKAAAAG